MSPQRRFLTRLFLSPTLYAIVGLLILASVLTKWLASHDPTTFRETFGAAAVAMTVSVHIVLAMTAFPADLISVANGAVYGLIFGTVLSCVGWWVAALLQFGLGRCARKDFDLANHSDRIPQWLQRLPIEHPLYLIGVRQVPWLGMHIGSFVPGAAGVKLPRFAWCSAIGVFPGSLIMTAIGAGIVHFR